MKVKDLVEQLVRMEPMENNLIIRDDNAHIFLAENEEVMYHTYKDRSIIYVPNKGMMVDPKTVASFQETETCAHTTYKCPNCGCTIHLDWHEKRNYCPECGTRLDWSQVNNERK